MAEPDRDVTELLAAWSAGDTGAFADLLPLVVDDLRRIAQKAMQRETPGHTLEATAVVNELYLKLTGKRSVHWQSRAQFFATMAQLMRRILVDHARRRSALKKGGGATRVTFGRALQVPTPAGADSVDLLALDQALDRLADMDSRQARIVEMLFFAGMTLEETAGHLEVSTMTVKRDWRSARLWLLAELDELQQRTDGDRR